MDYKNSIAKILFWIGIFQIVIGIILAFSLSTVDVGYYSSSYEISWGTFFTIFASSFVAGMILIGFGELIERQTETNTLLKKMIKDPIHQVASAKEVTTESVVSKSENEEEDNSIQVTQPELIDWDIEPDDLTKIHDYFEGKGRSVSDIIATPNEFMYVVFTDRSKHLISMDRGFSNQVMELDFKIYPKITRWLIENLKE
ncbi:hypothetical protein [Halalkalibacter alkalisediminis]|uniref:Uncharacterized protein n=1 Tax=Halalkalibacter alkalisediminis TaxID=935616 RepID=A0ABV6NG03_9BACI|nr:hypothetical protein [Halalkalibacter alkalisediminis]